MIPILLHRLSASSIECVVRMTLHSLSVVVIRLMISHMKRRAIGSIPVNDQGRQAESIAHASGLPITLAVIYSALREQDPRHPTAVLQPSLLIISTSLRHSSNPACGCSLRARDGFRVKFATSACAAPPVTLDLILIHLRTTQTCILTP